jgi:hypothetical protein
MTPEVPFGALPLGGAAGLMSARYGRFRPGCPSAVPANRAGRQLAFHSSTPWNSGTPEARTPGAAKNWRSTVPPVGTEERQNGTARRGRNRTVVAPEDRRTDGA